MSATTTAAAPTLALTLDGKPVSAQPGETLLDLARRHGIDLPTLCHGHGLEPAGNCRVCVVEVEGERALAAACCRRVAPGLSVRTDSARAVHARRVVTELLLSDAGTDTACLKPDSELHDTASKLAVTNSRFPERNRGYAEPDRSHPAIAVQLDACIQCTRCLRACRDLQVNDVIGLAGRGAASRIVFDADAVLGSSSCVACGECVQACPTGALAPAGGVGVAPVERRVDSVCPYCGVGCQLTWHVGPGPDGAAKIHFVTGRDGPANRGRLCVKGRYGFDYPRHTERLTQPLLRRDGVAKDPADIERVRRGELALESLFRPAGWDEALERAAGGLLRIRSQFGGAALAGFGSAKGSNEEAYLFQKLVRTGFGSHNVDHCTRLCHASSVAALLEGLGSGAVSNPVADVAQADLIFVIGANPSVNHPVAATWIKNAVKRGARLVLADPRRTPLARHAHWHLAFRPDTDVALLSALLHVIVFEGLADERFIEARVTGFDALKAAVAESTPERMAEICGIDAPTLRAVARAYAGAGRAMILWGMGISQHVHGTDNARCLIALALVSGQIGRPGTGLHPLRGQNNVQGASDAGLIPMMLPAYRRVAQAEWRAQFEALWGGPLAAQPGLTVVEIMHAIHDGRVRGMLIEGENPAMSDPDLQHARAALARLEHLVVQDIFPTETAILADVILPGSAHVEKWGSTTNTDRLIQIGRPALDPPGQARQDLWIIEQIGRRMGLGWRYWDAARDGDGRCAAEAAVAAVYEEMRQVMPGLAGVPWTRLVREDAVMTPAASEHAPGLAVEFSERFATEDGRGHLVPAVYRPGPERPDADFPLLLATGRLLEHWHTGAMTRRAATLDALAPRAEVSVHPLDAARLQLGDGEPVRLTTRHGRVDAALRISDEVQPGQIFLPFAYWEAAANLLTGAALDPVGKIPGFKVTAARLERLLGAAEMTRDRVPSAP
jgi:formate dehydrogenase major subunit